MNCGFLGKGGGFLESDGISLGMSDAIDDGWEVDWNLVPTTMSKAKSAMPEHSFEYLRSAATGQVEMY